MMSNYFMLGNYLQIFLAEQIKWFTGYIWLFILEIEIKS